MKSCFRFTCVAAVFGLVGCATVQMPQNVTTRVTDRGQQLIDTVDFSYTAASPRSFEALRLCVAENVHNREVHLQDSSGSFFGPASGRYYETKNSKTVQGGDIFKYIDSSLTTLIAIGVEDGGPAASGLTRTFIKFDLKASVRDTRVGIVFSNVTRAWETTGSLSNTGFGPIGTWSGANPMQAYAALQGVSNKISRCLQ